MQQDYNRIGIDATTRQQAKIGFVQLHKHGGSVRAKEVTVEEVGGAGSEWNIRLDDREVFAQTQSVAAGGTPETFVPDQNRYGTGDNLPLEIETTNQESSSETLNVGVLLESVGEQ